MASQVTSDIDAFNQAVEAAQTANGTAVYVTHGNTIRGHRFALYCGIGPFANKFTLIVQTDGGDTRVLSGTAAIPE
jgi:broad specificity phosphatase PhoE